MRFLFTCLLIVSVLAVRAQAPLTEAFHGCGGATVVSFPQTGWSNVTYTFQRQDGPAIWTTVLVSQSNWHIVLNGELTGPALFRCVQRNNITLEERISNGVTVDPALFPRAIVTPTVTVTPFWSPDADPNKNVLQVIISAPNGFTRPPFTVQYRKIGDIAFQQEIVANSFFIRNVEPNVGYEVRVTDFCGNTRTVFAPGPESVLFANVSNVTCSGGTVTFNLQGSANLNFRAPFSYALALLPAGTDPNAVPESFLNSLAFTISASPVNNVAGGRYVLVGRDVFGVRTKYTIVDVGSTANLTPNIFSSGPGVGFCNSFVSVADPGGAFGPWQVGIRVKGSGEPFSFSTNFSPSNLRGGTTYELVLRDNCGVVSLSTDVLAPLWMPRINNVSSTVNGCTGTITVNADVCNSSALYGLVEEGQTDTIWQAGNVFTVPAVQKDYRAYVRQTTSLTADRSFTSTGTIVSVSANWGFDDCSPTAEIAPFSPGLQWQLSLDGSNYTPPRIAGLTRNITPGVYDVRFLDGCGNQINRRYSFGNSFQLLDNGYIASCNPGDTLGGLLEFELLPLSHGGGNNPSPFRFELYEWTNGGKGNMVRSGFVEDQILRIAGLEGGKSYTLKVVDNCNREFFRAGRLPNIYTIDNLGSPLAIIQLDTTNCAEPFIRVSAFPAGSNIEIREGRGRDGNLVDQVSTGTTGSLNPGWYTVIVSNGDAGNGCPAILQNELYVKPSSGNLIGDADVNILTAYCAGDIREIDARSFWPNAIPNSRLTASAGFIWKDPVRGIFVPGAQPEGVYEIRYTNNSYCGTVSEGVVTVTVGPDFCSISNMFGDIESAGLFNGCVSTAGDAWKILANPPSGLLMAVNAGEGNTLSGTCWGARVGFNTQPRTATIGGNLVYFADRNFYIEPTQRTGSGNPSRVRLYYFEWEVNRLLDFVRSLGNPDIELEDLRILKKSSAPGSPADLDIAAGPANLYTYITPTFTSVDNGWAVEFEVNSFSEFALVFSAASALPVTWGSVDARLENGQVLVNWSTLTESNTKDFVVEHSVDGRTFSAVGTVLAAGNSTSQRTYNLRHQNPAVGKNYYRIRQNDKDGRFSYSVTVRVNTAGFAGSLKIMPNPAGDQAALIFGRPSLGGTISLVNMSGQIIWHKPLARGSSAVSLNLSGLAKGMYMVRIEAEGVTEILKLIKQ